MGPNDETFFKQMLCLERRRCERTGLPFGLMLVELGPLSKTLAPTIVESLGKKIDDSMRETDITGWYERQTTLGVICTTLNGSPREAAESAILCRTRQVLSLVLSSVQIEKIRLSFYLFPEDASPAGPRANRDLFYPDREKLRSNERTFVLIKRTMDILGSLLALVLLSPLFLMIVALIKLTSRGPAIFRQKRLGQYGREFTVLKFRSMHVDSDARIHQQYTENLISGKAGNGDGSYKMTKDPRVTRFGNLLRITSMDELPQFINVLKGEMSLVGPRPAINYEFEKYSLWHRRRILEAKPGITGIWQVNGRSRTTFDEMVRMDLQYINKKSVWLDLKILLKTPLVVLSGDGAY